MFLLGLGVGKRDQIGHFFTYSCKGYRFLDGVEDFEKQALIAVFHEHPGTDVKIISSDMFDPSNPDMFAPSLVARVGIEEKIVSRAESGHQSSTRQITKVFEVSVDGCGGARIGNATTR